MIFDCPDFMANLPLRMGVSELGGNLQVLYAHVGQEKLQSVVSACKWSTRGRGLDTYTLHIKVPINKIILLVIDI